jgi:hypothetical protein
MECHRYGKFEARLAADVVSEKSGITVYELHCREQSYHDDSGKNTPCRVVNVNRMGHASRFDHDVCSWRNKISEDRHRLNLFQKMGRGFAHV